MATSERRMSRFKVVVTDYVFPSLDIERAVLGAIGAECVALQASSEEPLVEAVPDADALLVCYAPVGRRVINATTRCRIIARYGIGVDNVDTDAASARGIVVTNVPDYCVEEVSDHALALLLALARKVAVLDRRVRAARWNARDAVPIRRLRGQVLGLVGFGKIPKALAAKAKGLGLEVMAFDPYLDEAHIGAHGARKVDLTTLLARADFVSIHAPLTPQTRGLIGEAELRAMKPTACLINTARGPIVQEAAVARGLREGWIAGAALDVLEYEPPAADHPMLSLDNVILTPHVAFYSEESLQELQRKASEEVARVLTGQPPRYPVNTPGPVAR
jgi:D-3-phosphoglycerate dehydrogenase